ncbi:MAG: proline--tRNA ligase [Candidatus Brocadiia bacterium]
MRWSRAFIPTLRESPADAVALSHRLLVRAGMLRRVGSGAYCYLPLGLRVLQNVMRIVREEMERAGALEVLMPALLSSQTLERSGRAEAFGQDVFSFSDRHGRDHVLAPTHEEVFTRLVGDEVSSYRRLPLILYQIQTKFRDEERPRFGPLRTREFIMKDAYSFSADQEGLDACYEQMRQVYERIFRRCGLETLTVEAEPGVMGGEQCHEFIAPCGVGADQFVRCPGCGYAANVECAAAPPPEGAAAQQAERPRLQKVDTPGRTSVEQVTEFLGVAPEELIKTIIYMADARPVAVLVRGDHDVNEAKVRRTLGAKSLQLADARTVEQVTGAALGFAGPVGLEGVELTVDHAVATMPQAVTGANEGDAHLVGVVPGRDFPVGQTRDLRYVTADDRCPSCGRETAVGEGVEVGHIFKLGTDYSARLGATFMDADGENRPCVMGCYGIGVNRIVAALIEQTGTEDGVRWPDELAPYQAVVMPLDPRDEQISSAAEQVYRSLARAGVTVLLDDRPERSGVKFNDADLIGFPVRVVIGRRYLDSGQLELQDGRDGSRSDVSPGEAVEAVRDRLSMAVSAGEK